MFAALAERRKHERGRTAGRDAHDDVFGRNMPLLQRAPAFIDVVLAFLKRQHEVFDTSGQHALDHLRINAVGVREFDGVEHREASSRTAAQIEHPAAVAQLVFDGADKARQVGQDLFDGQRNLLVLLVDVAEQFRNGFFLQIVVQRRLFGQSHSCKFGISCWFNTFFLP